MRIVFDESSAAFGLFHLAFANLEQELATAVFLIRRTRDSSADFKGIYRRGIAKVKEDLKAELKQLSHLPLMDLDAQDLNSTRAKVGALNAWRRERVHARVRLDADGIAIFDAKTGKHLPIERAECEEKIREAVLLAFNLQVQTRSFLQRIDAHKKWEELFEEIWPEIESAELDPE